MENQQVQKLLESLAVKGDVNRLREVLEAKQVQIEYMALEAVSNLLDLQDRWVGNSPDPQDGWRNIGGGGYSGGLDPDQDRTQGFANERDLKEARQQCRWLAQENEWAINGSENRISYTYGTGFSIEVSPKKDSDPDTTAEKIKAILTDWAEANDWDERQPEGLRRWDRDGEAFYRFFFPRNDFMRIRFVEPSLVSSEGTDYNEPHESFGIVTEPDDVETVVKYIINNEEVDPTVIQHRKANVDSNVKRGIPTFWPSRHNLDRAEKIIRNMAILVAIQTSIAMVERHDNTSSSALSNSVGKKIAASITNNTTGEMRRFEQMRPGRIIRETGNVSREFPAASVSVAGIVDALMAILRTIASRLIMPEFMFTSDASNGNYSSIMVAEGPPVKHFERLQHYHKRRDLQIIKRALAWEVQRGTISQSEVDSVLVQVVPPTVQTRNKLEDAKTNEILKGAGVLSVQTWSNQLQLNYKTEQANRLSHESKMGDLEQQQAGDVYKNTLPGKQPAADQNA